MFRISEFSKISRVPTKTLRYYDEIGLFSPAQVDQWTGYRSYAAEQLPRLNRILALKDMGLTLAEIACLLDEELSPEELRGMFRLKQAEMAREVADAQARLARVANRLHQIEQEGTMPQQDVVIKEIEPLYVLMVRRTAPTPDHVGTFLGESFAAMQQHGVAPAGPPMVIFYDEEFQPTDMDIATAIPVVPSVKDAVPLGGGKELMPQTLPAAHVASIVHHGSYDTFEGTYAIIGRWIAEHSYCIVGPVREIYLSPPSENGHPVTEIQFLVEQAE